MKQESKQRLQAGLQSIKLTLHDVLSGEFWMKKDIKEQFKLAGLIVIMIFVFTGNGYLSVKQQRHIIDLQKELEDLQYEYLTLSAQLVNQSRESNVSSLLKAEGSQLKEASTPAIKIE